MRILEERIEKKQEDEADKTSFWEQNPRHTQKSQDAFFGPVLPSEVSESAFFRNDFEKKKFRNGNAKPGNKKCLWAGTEK